MNVWKTEHAYLKIVTPPKPTYEVRNQCSKEFNLQIIIG